ncbi:sensor histidine kinase [Fusobacterium varium]|uniref:sensor histidine kinase n=1 Tax=Fusobacterium varium TaxID=856 RepID=UPI003567E3F2
MKLLTIRAKITLWYTLFMIGLVTAILGIIVEFTDMSILNNQKHELVKVVEDAAEDIEEGDDFDFYDDGVYLLKYNIQLEYIEGSIPDKFPISFPLESERVQSMKKDGEIFYIYDKKIKDEHDNIFWIRGVVPNIQIMQLGKIIIGAAFVLLPVLVILSSLIGYFITKKAFLPVKKIQETAQKISEGNKLYLRIGLPDGKDEISMLGKTVDNMLEKLEKSFEKEKQFTSDVSHELRTPIAVIMAESEYVLQHGTSFEEAIESIESINYQVNKMSVLINQLLFFSRAEQGKIQLNYEKTDILQLMDEIIKDIKFTAESKKIAVNIINKLTVHEYYVDKMLFSRVVQNVIQNAIIYGKENGCVSIEIYEKNSYIAIKIKDNGIGISKENLNKIWDRFYQVDQSRTNQENGSMGLGLSMVKWIIEKHKGYTEVESTLGVGSIFTLFFPIKI